METVIHQVEQLLKLADEAERRKLKRFVKKWHGK